MASTLLYRQLPSQMSEFFSKPSPYQPGKRRAHPTDLDSDDSSDDSSHTPARKRTRSSDEEGRSHFSSPNPAARGAKRAHDSEEEDDGVWGAGGGGDVDLDIHQSGPSYPSTGFPPSVKRLRRTLSDSLTKLGLSEDARVRQEQEDDEIVEELDSPGGAYSVQEPGEVGPAVWVGHAPTPADDEEVRFSVVGEEEEEVAARDLAVGFWRGRQSTPQPVDVGEFFLFFLHLSRAIEQDLTMMLTLVFIPAWLQQKPTHQSTFLPTSLTNPAPAISPPRQKPGTTQTEEWCAYSSYHFPARCFPSSSRPAADLPSLPFKQSLRSSAKLRLSQPKHHYHPLYYP